MTKARVRKINPLLLLAKLAWAARAAEAALCPVRLLPAVLPPSVCDTNGRRAAGNDCALGALPGQTTCGAQATACGSCTAGTCYKGKIQTTLYRTDDELAVSSEVFFTGERFHLLHSWSPRACLHRNTWKFSSKPGL